MNQQTNIPTQEPQSGKLYRGKAPILLQIIGGLMWFGGFLMILQGLPLLLLLGFGIIPIILGVFNIKYAKAIFKMQKKGYKGTLILQGFGITLSIVLWAISGFSNVSRNSLIGIGYALIVSLIVYSYRKQFVN